MKKAKQIVSILLCVLMLIGILPTVVFASEEAVVDPGNTLGQDILVLSADRYTVLTGNAISYIDTGYGAETTYLFPRGTGTKYFSISRCATDYNRWWRWAKEGDKIAQATSNSEAGYNAANPGVAGMEAWIHYEWGSNSRNLPIPKDGSREKKYIVSKARSRWLYNWRGGSRNNAQTVQVSIDRTLALGTSAILWSANGTCCTQGAAYVASSCVAPGGTNGLNEDKRVEYGDIGANYMRMVEPRYVHYDLGNGSAAKYVVWTTGTAKTSQKHQAIAAPTKEGYIFAGWLCTESGKLIQPGCDVNNGVTCDLHLVAQWIAE